VVGILVGAALYGLPGAFLAVPLAAAVQVVLAHVLEAEGPAQAAVHAELGERGPDTAPAPNYDSLGGPGMVMLSELRRFELVDERGGRAQLLDVAVDMSAGDYPPVTRLFFRGPSKRQEELPWEALSAVDWERRKMTVPDLNAGRAAPNESLTDVVLLKRDVSDALVLDLANRRAARANDLWLVEDDDHLRLRGVDVAPWAVARRLVRRRIGPPVERGLLDWRDVEFLRGDPRAAAAGRDYHRQIGRLPAGEIAHLADEVPYLHAAELLTLLPEAIAADAFELMSPERQRQVLGELDEEQTVRIVALMAPDAAADLIGRLGAERAQALLDGMPPARAEPVLELLRYPEDTAGGIMTNLVVTVPADLTIAEARRALKAPLKEPDFVYFVYVVDDAAARRLQGVITLRDLIVRDDEERVRDVMRASVVAIDALEPAQRAAARVTDSHLAGLPVVGREGRLLGVVTVDAAVALIAPQAWSAQAPRVFS
jgi:CBS domain-containing protein